LLLNSDPPRIRTRVFVALQLRSVCEGMVGQFARSAKAR
jgi:hypothetical protein